MVDAIDVPGERRSTSMPSFKEILERAKKQVPWEYLQCHKTCETIIDHYKTLFPQPFKLDVLKKI